MDLTLYLFYINDANEPQGKLGEYELYGGTVGSPSWDQWSIHQSEAVTVFQQRQLILLTYNHYTEV